MNLVSAIKLFVGSVQSRWLAFGVAITMPVLSLAQTAGSQTTGLAGFDAAAKAAGNKKIDNVMASASGTANSAYDAFIIGITVFGVVLVGLSLYGMYKASADERETPKKAIVGLVVGGALTVVGIITAYSANTLTT
jgi:hypothetical protein